MMVAEVIVKTHSIYGQKGRIGFVVEQFDVHVDPEQDWQPDVTSMLGLSFSLYFPAPLEIPIIKKIKTK